MTRAAGALLAILLTALAPMGATSAEMTVGSKKFTENVILGEIVAGLGRTAGARVRHRRELGGTRVLWQALLKGEIDAYPEYTGTIAREILAGKGLTTAAEIRAELTGLGLRMTGPIGFNNTYAIGLRRDVSARLKLRTISDLRHHPGLRFGFGNEFMDRSDGWPSLRDRYRLPHKDVRGLDHDLAYRGLQSGDIDAMDVYTTDAEIAYYGLALLEDDLRHFPVYDAVIVYRADLASRLPGVAPRLESLAGRIDATAMAGMNAEVKLERRAEASVAGDFLAREFGAGGARHEDTMAKRFVRNTADHLALVAVSLFAAILVSVPLGIAAVRRPRAGQAILATVGILQTIPSLALFVFMIPLLGIGGPPAAVALFLYSLLPIVRNTHAGLAGIPPSLTESAEALGLSPAARLRLVELPLAAPTILAGIKTSAVINVGTATLGALIGAGGYGQPILTGIRLDDIGLILEGAVPAAALALAVQAGFEAAERLVVAKGLRLGDAT